MRLGKDFDTFFREDFVKNNGVVQTIEYEYNGDENERVAHIGDAFAILECEDSWRKYVVKTILSNEELYENQMLNKKNSKKGGEEIWETMSKQVAAETESHPGLIDFGLFLKQSIFTSDHRRDCYKRIIRPRMIILITGASHTGKTLLAQRMLEKYKYPYLSIDHLKMGLIRSGNTFLTPKDDDALTEYLWPIVREMIKTAIENSQNLIVEGCYVPFDWRRDFDENYLSSIRFICLAMTGRYIDEHFKDITGYGSAIESRLDDSECSLCGLKEDNKRCLEGFIQAGEQVLLIDDSFERVLEALLES